MEIWQAIARELSVIHAFFHTVAATARVTEGAPVSAVRLPVRIGLPMLQGFVAPRPNTAGGGELCPCVQTWSAFATVWSIAPRTADRTMSWVSGGRPPSDGASRLLRPWPDGHGTGSRARMPWDWTGASTSRSTTASCRPLSMSRRPHTQDRPAPVAGSPGQTRVVHAGRNPIVGLARSMPGAL